MELFVSCGSYIAKYLNQHFENTSIKWSWRPEKLLFECLQRHAKLPSFTIALYAIYHFTNCSSLTISVGVDNSRLATYQNTILLPIYLRKLSSFGNFTSTIRPTEWWRLNWKSTRLKFMQRKIHIIIHNQFPAWHSIQLSLCV